MRRSLLLSGGLHLLVLMALLLGVSSTKRFAEPVEQGIPVELVIAMGPTAPAETPTAPSEPAPQPTLEPAPTPEPPPPPPTPPPPTPPPPRPPAPPPPVQTPPVQRPQEGSTALQNTLERLRQQQAQQQPPRPRQPQGGRPPTPGAPGGTAPSPGLTRGEIDGLRELIEGCWSVDAGMRGLEEIVVELQVRLRPDGSVVQVRPAGPTNTGDPRWRTVYETAQRALLSPRCNPLPIPPEKRPTVETAVFRFNARGLVR